MTKRPDQSRQSPAFDAEPLIRALFEFLASDRQSEVIAAVEYDRDNAQKLLQELIPGRIECRGLCSGPVAAVTAAPHVSFDNWSEYFCNRAARTLQIGWVVALNYRDQDKYSIPVAIGRHIHVNRPTESAGPRRKEVSTNRAGMVHQEYISTLRFSCGRGSEPVDLLFEFHSHRRSPDLEIATTGFSESGAHTLLSAYNRLRTGGLPDLRIDPIHELKLSASQAKRIGSLRPEVARAAMHIEIPKSARRDEAVRQACSDMIIEVLRRAMAMWPVL